MEVVQAKKQHVQEVAKLFDLYRQFYDCQPDLQLATDYISNRIENHESTIFIAVDNDAVLGFVQLYPSFCSIDAVNIFILHDLYVEANARNAGVGAALMNQATRFAKQQGAGRIDLMTDKTNQPGQHLYEKLGYQKTLENFYSYSLRL